jgi:hypothetical protein
MCNKKYTVREFYEVHIDGRGEFVAFEGLKRDPELLGQVVNKALAEAEEWREQYEGLFVVTGQDEPLRIAKAIARLKRELGDRWPPAAAREGGEEVMATKSKVVRLWRELVISGFDRAAVGLLTDVLDWTVSDEQREHLGTDLQQRPHGIVTETLIQHGVVKLPPPRDDEGQRRRAESRRLATEDARAMLEDETGDRLAEAVEQYTGEDFEDWALTWVEGCSRRWGWWSRHKPG